MQCETITLKELLRIVEESTSRLSTYILQVGSCIQSRVVGRFVLLSYSVVDY